MELKKFTNFVVEELTDDQKDKVDLWDTNPDASVNISKHVIPKGTDRLTIPLSDPNDAQAPNDIKAHLQSHGAEVTDYKQGRGKDKYGREIKIGKFLSKTSAPKELIDKFAADPERSNAIHSDLQVVVSRHPYDVAGMSTDRRWTSCMDMSTPSEPSNLHEWKMTTKTDYIPHELKAGTHMAYLTYAGDHKAEDPLARIALKPHAEEGSTRVVLIPEHKIYGSAASAFEHTVNSWTNDYFPLKDDTFYMKHSEVYDDDDSKVASKIDTVTGDHVKRILNTPTPDYYGRASKLRKLIYIAKHGNAEHLQVLKDSPDVVIQKVISRRKDI